ncbi:MAG TPA: CapA family protein [Candidatus Paceibacterota bacterium]|nr:CapA family protein [Candidatus Paceibacterota bacterium]
MKKDIVVWCFVGALIIAGIVAAMWPKALAEIATDTSHIFGTPTIHNPSVLFVGDIMLDRDVAVHAQQAGDDALFAGAADLFSGYDLRIGNLEGTITTNKSIAQQDHTILRFTFDPRFAKVLAQAGFDALSLANNHSLDFGEFGYDDTVSYLSKQNIPAFGSPFNEQHLAVRVSASGLRLCMLGYMDLFKSDPTSIINKIQDIRGECDKVIVMPHWGVEYQHSPTAQQVSLAHEFIDAGADVIIGSHPHVVEPLEIYKGKAIFYSLGNFIFDQHWQPEVMRGLAVGIEFGEKSTRFTLTPVSTNMEAKVADEVVTKAVLNDVVTPDLSVDMANSILTTSSFELPY